MRIKRNFSLETEEMKLLAGTDIVVAMLTNQFIIDDWDSDEELQEIQSWLEENMTAIYCFGMASYTSAVAYFSSEKDAMLFKMRWMGA